MVRLGTTMEDAGRFRWLRKYRTPRFRIGQRVFCEVRGERVITGMTDAPIPWPIGKHGTGRHSLIVYKGLAKAVRRESNQAVAYWWGVDPQTVTKWRKVLSVQRTNEGTSRLFQDSIAEYGDDMCALGVLKARDPERRRKIAEPMRGKPKPPLVLEAMHEARRGSHHTKKTRRRMSETHRQRGTLVPGTTPWTAEEDELVRTLPVEEVDEGRDGACKLCMRGGARYECRMVEGADEVSLPFPASTKARGCVQTWQMTRKAD
jgi:hypothetical protein